METLEFIKSLVLKGIAEDVDNLFNLNYRLNTAGTMPFFAYEMTKAGIVVTPTLSRYPFSLPAELWEEAQRTWKAVYAFERLLKAIYKDQQQFAKIVYSGYLGEGLELKAQTENFSTYNMPSIRLHKLGVTLSTGLDYKHISLANYDVWLELFSEKTNPLK